MSYRKPSFDTFIGTLKKTIKDIDYYVDYQKVFSSFDRFKDFIFKIGTVDQDLFCERFLKLANIDRTLISLVPLLVGVRDPILSIYDKTRDSQDWEINFNVIQPQEALEFLKKAGFFKIFEKSKIVDLPSYYFGLEVGLDSHGRKNRSGKLMELQIRNSLEKFKNSKNYYFKMQIKINDFLMRLDKNLIHEFNSFKPSSEISEKKFDFIFIFEKNIFLGECNFFNVSGSKIKSEFSRFDILSQELQKYKLDLKEEYQINLLLVTDGQAFLKNQKLAFELYERFSFIFNLETFNNFLKSL